MGWVSSPSDRFQPGGAVTEHRHTPLLKAALVYLTQVAGYLHTFVSKSIP